MKKNINIENIEIPAYEEKDIIAVIRQSKELLANTNMQKKESSIFQTAKQLLFIDGWKSLSIQVFLILAGLILIWSSSATIWVSSSRVSSLMSIALLSVGGTIMATVIAVEFLRNDIYGMREIEMTCNHSLQRLLVLKMLLLSILAILGIALFSYAVMLKSNIDYMTLLCGGCIPFLFMNGCTLLLHTNKNPLYILLTLYICTFALLCVLEYSYIDKLLHYLETWGLFFMLSLLLFNIVLMLFSKKRRYAI